MKNLGRIFLIFMISTYFSFAGDGIKIEKVKKKESDIEFKIFSDKKEAFIGEPITVTLRLKIKKSLEIVDYRFSPPVFNDFWVKRVDEDSSGKYLLDTPKYLVKELKYVVFPQKNGVLKIGHAIIKIATPDTTQDLFGVVVTVPKWRSVKSNLVNIVVKPLPKDVNLVGNFDIKTYVDKKEAKINEPINFTIEIFGEGNIENFDKIELNIPGATVFSDIPKKMEKFKNKKLEVKFIQKFSIVSDKDFIIPSVEVEYFDLDSKTVKVLKSKKIKIDIINGLKNEKKYNNNKIVKQTKSEFDTKYFLLGFIAGILLTAMIFFAYIIFKKRSIKIRFSSSEKELLNRVLPYISQNYELELFAKELYENIYEGKKHKIDKKRLNKLLNVIEKKREEKGDKL
ncbi:BatD family protein [Nitrosophilus labii]|uniref:BatD family protein n=1 Tax=Nitrosophilus labii TaxID=2706014 RepID=UPI001657047E|nr:BatD family protein [Nitrosophilus labii]